LNLTIHVEPDDDHGSAMHMVNTQGSSDSHHSIRVSKSAPMLHSPLIKPLMDDEIVEGDMVRANTLRNRSQLSVKHFMEMEQRDRRVHEYLYRDDMEFGMMDMQSERRETDENVKLFQVSFHRENTGPKVRFSDTVKVVGITPRGQATGSS